MHPFSNLSPQPRDMSFRRGIDKYGRTVALLKDMLFPSDSFCSFQYFCVEGFYQAQKNQYTH